MNAILRPFNRLEGKLRLAFVATALLSIAAFALAALPIVRGSIRDDRIKLFVESTTRALAENVSHGLLGFQRRAQIAAANLALSPAARELSASPRADEIRVLNDAVCQPAPPLARYGLFDLLAVIDGNGTILFTNTEDRFGRPLGSRALWGRSLSEFPEADQAWRAAAFGPGKMDWHRSTLFDRVRPAETGDIARQYSFGFVEPIPNSQRMLLALVNWEAVQKILDDVEEPLHKAGFPSSYAFMFAKDADSIIGHHFRDPATRNNYGTSVIRDHNLPEVVEAARTNKASLRYEYPPGTRKVSGLSRIDDADFGWVVGLGINDSDVIAPMQRLTLLLMLVGAALIIVALVLSHFLSKRITVNLTELTRSVERISDGFLGESVTVRSRDEVGQLAAAFNQMTAALTRRDEVILQQQQLLMERRRIEQELHIAGEVQRRLFPQVRPPLRTLDYVGFCQPARGVSGDYFDFLALAPSKLGLMLADVSGKGISAALLMASLHACVRTHAPLYGDRCGEVVTSVNSLLYEATDPDRFATIFYAVYDDATSRLTYINAGHDPALLIRANGRTAAAASVSHAHAGRAEVDAATAEPLAEAATQEWLDFGTPPVGIFETLPAVEKTITLFPGDLLVLYSDGVLETTNPRGEEFGRARLMETILRHQHLGAQLLAENLLSELSGFAGNRAQEDDRTLIVARVL